MTDKTEKSFSVWAYKPWWCQPWSIVLTGSSLIAGSGWLSHRLWVSGLVAVPIVAWMGYFLLVYPRSMAKLWQSKMEQTPPQ